MQDREKHMHCTNKFIALANEFNEEGFNIATISAALMSASSIYATYVAAGNAGALNPSGVDKVVNLYRKTLDHVQKNKKAESLKGVEDTP